MINKQRKAQFGHIGNIILVIAAIVLIASLLRFIPINWLGFLPNFNSSMIPNEDIGNDNGHKEDIEIYRINLYYDEKKDILIIEDYNVENRILNDVLIFPDNLINLNKDYKNVYLTLSKLNEDIIIYINPTLGTSSKIENKPLETYPVGKINTEGAILFSSGTNIPGQDYSLQRFFDIKDENVRLQYYCYMKSDEVIKYKSANNGEIEIPLCKTNMVTEYKIILEILNSKNEK